jgi:acetylornithine deacetylase/succinyl-diaminopimelate desuccinylase-like protein
VTSTDVERAVALVPDLMRDARHDLDTLVRVPSISASPQHVGQVQSSAQLTAEMLTRCGLEDVRIVSVENSHPYVIGEFLHAEGAPTILLYAHHDVQPPGMEDRWTSPPFEPVERAGRLYGRGSADDKAGAVAHAAAVAAWLRSGAAPPCNVRVVVEGEEEIGSPHLLAFLTEHAAELRSDVLLLADAQNWRVGLPALTYSLRGLTAVDVTLRSLEGPVHSGVAGGAAPDPVMALARVLASLTDEWGDLAIDGYWDDVDVPSAAEREALRALPGADDEFRTSMGVRPGVDLAGDPALSVWERLWLRPSVTVIGLDAHPIRGSSNQIVASASARLSVRLAPGQDPQRAFEQLRAHIEAAVPWHLECKVTELVRGTPAWQTRPEGFAFDAATRALRAAFGVDPVLMGEGGSIPFVAPFAEAFGGIPALLLGPGDPTSRIHGEDESLHLDDWRKLVETEVRLLAELAERAAS